MHKRIHGWILATVLGGTGGTLAQDAVLPPVVIPPKRDRVTIQEAVPQSNSPAPIFAAPPQPATSGGMWFNAEFLTMWAKGANVPAIVGGATQPSSGPVISGPLKVPTSPGFIGLVGLSGTQQQLSLANAPETLAGDNITGANFGGRLLIGTWLDGTGTFGVELGYSFLFMSHGSTVDANGLPAISIPYTDALTGRPTGYPIVSVGVPTVSALFINTTPDVFVGLFKNYVTDRYVGIAGIHLTGDMQGVEANGVMSLVNSPDVSLELTAGFRYLQLQEHLSVTSEVVQDHVESTVREHALGVPGPEANVNDFLAVVNRTDDFRTRNSFYGGQIGARGEVRTGGVSVGFGAALAMGDMIQSVDISGQNFSTTALDSSPVRVRRLAGIPITVPTGFPIAQNLSGFGPTGLFAQPTNSGVRSRDVFAVVPQGNLRVGYRISESLTASLGYNFMYINNVARPGDQIDYALNANSVTLPSAGGGPLRPLPQLRGTDFWLQGIDVGVQLRY
jgi:hypothetical protein